MKAFLVLILFCSFNVHANSFVAQGKIEEITLIDGRELMVEIMHQPHKDDCQGERFYLNVQSEIELQNTLMLLNTALANNYTITLHNKSGAECTSGKVLFDILKVRTY
ncbi:hypothetical protein J8M20_02630 [Pseudoalteromonas luteoviolacea]|uniref:hypothetical protein n=1 Tax=Pseudoalteromonas luteoviolacea TaxID=43657 RepID=UPI001B363D3F|nr:hypothetical protein [Pseudoalteromonas luteoviolacea]MBQ4810209.1 hypothetical protein [Pseudoalteromonas luteoviolacea]